MKKNKHYRYNFMVIPIGEDGDEAYEAIIPKFENMHVFADSIEELHEQVTDVIDGEIEKRKKLGIPIPKEDGDNRDKKKSRKFSGKLLLRLDPKTHRDLFYEAMANRMSLNSYLISKLNKLFPSNS